MLKEMIPSFDGRPLNVFYTGLSPDRPNVVLALPFGVRHAIADQFYAALAPHVNLITWESRFVLDLRADASEDGFDVDYHVHDLVRVASHANALLGRDGPTDVIGYCSGAGIGLLAATRHPDRVRRLALVSGEFMLPPSICKQSGFQREVDVLLPTAAASKDMARMLYDKISSGRSAPQSEFHDYISLPFSSADYLHRYGLNYVAYRRVDFLSEARDVAQPTLVLATRHDRQVTLESAHIIRARLPAATGVLEVDGDHYELCRANPGITNELLHFFEPERIRLGVMQ
ncbi:alpha/beta fold hydrolase [Burkholderia alba]|uniref:alpha/beta fold hydrolase n=1 Tax=Burkholderia alba TaxID=2683677 RepID=UPI002B05754C|nr:alpha/beta fold hydrolase [Burkholderia alba]